MIRKSVLVFGSTGVQGRAQVKELIRNGYVVKASSPDVALLDDADFDGAERIYADYDDPASIEAALHGVEAIFYQSPSMGDVARVNRQTETVRKATEKMGVEVVILNSSMWAPDEPCGQYTYDGVLSMEEIMRDGPVPVITFRPTPFMSNLHGGWAKQSLRRGIYRNCHKPDLKADWICVEDVAKFMVAALGRPDLAGRKIRIGGPEKLTTRDVIQIIGDAMGKQLDFEYVTIAQMVEEFWGLWGPSTGLEHDEFVDGFESFYKISIGDPRHPFEADTPAALDLIPIELTSMRSWASQQDWR